MSEKSPSDSLRILRELSKIFSIEGINPKLLTETKPQEIGEVEKVVRTNCFECHTKCGVLVQVKEGKILKIEGNPEHPYTKGVVCSKGLAATQLFYHPERLKYPLKRVGKRGEGKWVRTTWEEALTTISQRLLEIKQRYGAECVAFGQGTGRGTNQWMNRIKNTFGTPNVANPGYVCLLPGLVTAFESFGRSFYPFLDSLDRKNANCIVIWGSNFVWTESGLAGPELMEAIDRGAKLIVIDPRFENPLASKADIWLPVRPGTDGALALSWLQIIISEALYDQEFVEQWTNGPFLVWTDTKRIVKEAEIIPDGDPNKPVVWDQITDRVQGLEREGLKPSILGSYEIDQREVKPAFQLLSDAVAKYTPEVTAEITWVPADKIRDSARLYARHRPAVLDVMQGVEEHTNSGQTLRAICCLIAITGNLDVEGGHVWYPYFWNEMLGPYLGDTLPPEQAQKRIRLDEASFSWGRPKRVWESIITGDPYQIKAYVVTAGNPLSWSGHTKEVKEALEKLEFLVVVDYFMSPTAQLADFVLPGAHWLERDYIADEVCKRFYFAQQRSVDPLYARKSDIQWYLELGQRIAPDKWPWEVDTDILNYQLAPFKISWEELKKKWILELEPVRYKKYQEKGFPTPSGRVELFSPSFQMVSEPLPHYLEPALSPLKKPDLVKEYPFILVTGIRSPLFYGSAHRNIAWLRALQHHPRVEINPKTAKQLAIEDGDWVWIETSKGRIRHKAKLTPGIHPKVISTQLGWWQDCKSLNLPSYSWDGANTNILVDNEDFEPHFGCDGMRSQLCKIYKAEEGF
jgi:anaerobic selenocysteine-containing dehydrogenase